MSFWDSGLMGEYSYPTSSGYGEPASAYGNHTKNISNPVLIESFNLDSSKTDGQSYRILLNTFSLGTQLYLNVAVSKHVVNYFSTMIPYETTYMTHSFGLVLKNGNVEEHLAGGTSLSFLTDYYSGGDAPSGLEYSIYGFFYGYTNGFQGDPVPQYCFPFDGRSAALNSRVCCICDSSGVEFFMCGYGSEAIIGDVHIPFECPVFSIGKIPSTLLNDGFWFDPNNDGYVGDQGTGGSIGVGGNVPSLPVSPSYPGSDIDFPSLPTGADAFGFSRMALYKPSSAQLASALDILYSDSTESTLETIIESCKKWWYKPDQYCVALMLSPVNATTSASKNIKFGKYDSEVSAPFVASQWQITDCGSITVPLKYGSFLDFEPHAKVKLYLPFVGFRSLNANEVIGGTIYIKYYTDMLTGASIAMVKIARTGSNTSILYTFDCNVNVQVPLTAMNYNQVISGLLQASVAGLTLGAGVGAGAISGAMAKYAAAGTVGSGLSSGMGMGSPELTQSGSISSNTGVLSHPKPYLCVQMPIPTTPGNYNIEKGRPSNIYMNISSCKGYTVIENLHVDIPGITSQEATMIRDLFKRGVYC